MLAAPPCRCIPGPRIFEEGWCHRCGKQLVATIVYGDSVDGLARLITRVQEERQLLRERALHAGVDTENRDQYREFILRRRHRRERFTGSMERVAAQKRYRREHRRGVSPVAAAVRG